MGRAGVATESFGSRLGSLAKTAGLVMGGAAIGGLVVGLKDSVQQALNAQASTARLDVAFKNAGLSATGAASQISAVEDASRKLGFTDNDVRDALGSLITATGDAGKAMSDLSVAEDIARFKNVGLSDASKMLTTAMAGSQRAAHQLGIIVMPVTTNLDALKASNVDLTTATGKLAEAHAKLLDKMATGNAVIQAVSDKVKGQGQAFADTAAGGMQQFQAQLDHLEVTIGTAVLPVLSSFLTKVTDGIQWVQHFADALHSMGGQAADATPPLVNAGNSAAHTGAQMDSATAAALKYERAVHAIEVVYGDIGGVLAYAGKGLEQLAGNYSTTATETIKAAHAAAAWAADVGDALTRVDNAVKNAATVAFRDAEDIGKAITGGIVSGLGDIVHIVGDAIGKGIHGAVGVAKTVWAWAHSPSMLTAQELGLPLVQGIGVGFAQGLPALQAVVSDNLDSLMAAASKRLVAGMAAMAKEIGVAGPSTLGDASSLASIAGQQATNASNLATYQGNYYDTTFATPGYSVGMSAAQVYALSAPHAASGGYVAGTGLALIHKGETVTPAGKGGSDTFNIYVPGAVGTMQQFEQAVISAMARANRRGSVSLAIT